MIEGEAYKVPTSKRLSSTMGLTRRSSEGTPAAPCLAFASLTFSLHCSALGRRFCKHTSRAAVLTSTRRPDNEQAALCKPLILELLSRHASN